MTINALARIYFEDFIYLFILSSIITKVRNIS